MTAFEIVRLGQEIRRRRHALGWTLDQFAEACSITPNYLGSIEAGKHDVHVTTLLAIARAFECNMGDLMMQPDQDLSPAAREMGQLFDRAPPDAQDAATRMLRVLVKGQSIEKQNDKNKSRPGDKDANQGKSTRRGRDRGAS